MRTLNTFLAVVALAALTACGGGGGGGETTPTPTNPTNPTDPVDVVAKAGTLQTNVGASTYVAASLQADAYATLNTVRAGAGAGLLAQGAQLDTAASAHALYLTTNIADGIGHTEDSTKVDFYEATMGLRLAKAGFSAGYSTEVIGGTGASLQGADCILGLMNTVYHAAALLSPSTTVGVGFGTDAAGIPLCVADLAATSTASYVQVAPAGSLVAYPSGGQSNVLETFYVAYESPRPSASLFPNTTAGTPVVVNVRNADFVNAKAAGTLDVAVTAFEIKDAGGNVVPVGILANSDVRGSGVTLTADANLGEGFVVMVPLAPLAKASTYSVTFTATVKAGATPVTKTWSFTTAQ